MTISQCLLMAHPPCNTLFVSLVESHFIALVTVVAVFSVRMCMLL